MCPRCTLGLLVLGAHAKMPPLRHFAAERCESGRFGVPGEHVCWQRHRGFESHPLRHTELRVSRPPLRALTMVLGGRRDTLRVWRFGKLWLAGQLEPVGKSSRRCRLSVDPDVTPVELFDLRTREGAGPCATESCEPRQVRKEAPVSRLVLCAAGSPGPTKD